MKNFRISDAVNISIHGCFTFPFPQDEFALTGNSQQTNGNPAAAWVKIMLN